MFVILLLIRNHQFLQYFHLIKKYFNFLDLYELLFYHEYVLFLKISKL